MDSTFSDKSTIQLIRQFLHPIVDNSLEYVRNLNVYIQSASAFLLLYAFLITARLLVLFLIRRNRTKAERPVALTVEVPEQCKPGWEGKVLDEPSITVHGSTAVQCYCPATGQSLGLLNPTTADGIDRAIEKAAEAQQQWAETSFSQRRKVLKTLLRFLLRNQEPIVRAACLDSGKTRLDATFGEVLVTAEKLKWTIDHGEEALSPSHRPSNFLMFYKDNEVQYEPLGVVAACVSWNYPFHNFIGPVISALFSGNAIIVKNSEQVAWCTAYYCGIVREALKACGHSPELVHTVTCWPQTAGHFTSHPGISHLTFIGSKPVAHHVASSAAKSLTPLCVELGGKDAAIVLDDPAGKAVAKSEMGRVESIILRGFYQSAGQNCIGIERVVAMPQAYDYLVKSLAQRVKALRLGWDLDESTAGEVDVGATISSANHSKLEELIHEAVAQGARLLAGGGRYVHPRYPKGHYFEPTLLADVTPSMRIAQQELFSPVCILMRAESVEDCIAITNSTMYGLGCSVFGPTTSTAARRNLDIVTKGVKTGMVAVNDFAVFYAVQLPFGGVRGSGYGRFAGEEGLRSLCNAKSVCKDRWPNLIKTSIPGKLDYPMKKDSWNMSRGVVELGYGDTFRTMLGGIRRMVGL